jgi:hypothetical protein
MGVIRPALHRPFQEITPALHDDRHIGEILILWPRYNIRSFSSRALWPWRASVIDCL